MESEKVLITGATGFIGSHLAERLVKDGHRVVVLLKPGDDEGWIDGLDLIRVYGDLTEEIKLGEEAVGVSMVFHLAAEAGGRCTPEEIFAINLEGTKNLLSACHGHRLNLKRFLFVSTVAAAGPNRDKTPVDEEDPDNPQTVYGRSKLAAEQLLRENCREIPFTILRLPLVYGPRSMRGLFPVFKMAKYRYGVTVTKNRVTLGFIQDIVRGIIQAAFHPESAGRMYYLGENTTYGSDEIVRMVGVAMDRKTLKIHVPYPLLYAAAWVLDRTTRMIGKLPVFIPINLGANLKMNWGFSTDKAVRDFGYQTKYPLAEGLKITAEWYKRHRIL